MVLIGTNCRATGQQYFLNNTFTYTVGDFPLSKKGFESAARCIPCHAPPQASLAL